MKHSDFQQNWRSLQPHLHRSGEEDKRDGEIDFLGMLNRSSKEKKTKFVDNFGGSFDKSLGFQGLGLCIF